MLGRQGAVELEHESVDLGGHGVTDLEPWFDGLVGDREDHHVEVAVTHVTEAVGECHGGDLGGGVEHRLHELLHLVDRYCRIELEPMVLMFDVGRGRRDVVADRPEVGLLLGCSGDGGIDDQACFGTGFEEGGNLAIDRVGAGELDEREILGVGVERFDDIEHVDHAIDGDERHQLECRHRAGGVLLRKVEERSERIEPGDRSEQRRLVRRGRPQLQHGRGDDAERAFPADEEVLEVVARGVLHEGAASVPDRAVGEHRFDPHDVVAHVAVANDIVAAGVGCDAAAHRRRAASTPVGGEHPVDRLRGVLDGLDGDTGLRRDCPTIRVDGLDLVETGE